MTSPEDKRNTVLRILLADDDTARAGALTKVLSADSGLTILLPPPGELLADAVAAHAPDVILVDMARPDRDALEGIRVVASNAPGPIVLFVDHDDPAFMEEAILAGVSSYNVLEVPPTDVKPILRAAAATFRLHQAARAELRQAEDQLRERETVVRAKTILIKERRMTEPEAYRWLRTRAMATARRIPDVAQEIVGRESVKSPPRAGEPGGQASAPRDHPGIMNTPGGDDAANEARENGGR
jgi:response regulator NasT